MKQKIFQKFRKKKKEKKAVSKIKDISVTFAPKMDVTGQEILKPEFDKNEEDWYLPFDKSKTKLPKGAKENFVQQLVDKLFFLSNAP